MPNPWDRQPRQTTDWLPESEPLPCPVCGTPTDSLKQFRFLSWCVFYLAGATYKVAFYRACPGCMRNLIARRAAWNIVPANLLWPFLVLPWAAWLFAATYRKGHSPDVLRRVSPVDAARNELARTAAASEVSWARVWAITAVLFFWLPVVGLVFAGLAYATTRKSAGRLRTVSTIALVVTGLLHLALAVAIAGAEAGWW